MLLYGKFVVFTLIYEQDCRRCLITRGVAYKKNFYCPYMLFKQIIIKISEGIPCRVIYITMSQGSEDVKLCYVFFH